MAGATRGAQKAAQIRSESKRSYATDELHRTRNEMIINELTYIFSVIQPAINTNRAAIQELRQENKGQITSDKINIFPNEIWLHIFSFFSNNDLKQASRN